MIYDTLDTVWRWSSDIQYGVGARIHSPALELGYSPALELGHSPALELGYIPVLELGSSPALVLGCKRYLECNPALEL